MTGPRAETRGTRVRPNVTRFRMLGLLLALTVATASAEVIGYLDFTVRSFLLRLPSFLLFCSTPKKRTLAHLRDVHQQRQPVQTPRIMLRACPRPSPDSLPYVPAWHAACVRFAPPFELLPPSISLTSPLKSLGKGRTRYPWLEPSRLGM